MEIGETTSEGAAREVWEEAQARVVIQELAGIYENSAHQPSEHHLSRP
jgi:ADP-ribose pyrophosphatase YjhB (NUDIX family)